MFKFVDFFYIQNNLEPYAIKIACTVLKGGNFSNKITYLNRPFAALLLLNIDYNIASFSVEGNCLFVIETPLLCLLYSISS